MAGFIWFSFSSYQANNVHCVQNFVGCKHICLHGWAFESLYRIHRWNKILAFCHRHHSWWWCLSFRLYGSKNTALNIWFHLAFRLTKISLLWVGISALSTNFIHYCTVIAAVSKYMHTDSDHVKLLLRQQQQQQFSSRPETINSRRLFL